MFSSFGRMFQFASVFSTLVFVSVIGVFAYVIIRGLSVWIHNNNSPEESVPVTVVSRRDHVSVSHHNSEGLVHSSSTTAYYVTFETQDGERMELRVPAKEFGLIVEGDRGILRYRGTRYLSFERER